MQISYVEGEWTKLLLVNICPFVLVLYKLDLSMMPSCETECKLALGKSEEECKAMCHVGKDRVL